MELREAVSMLSRTPSTLESLLGGLPDDWVHRNDGPGTWSAYDILGHLETGDLANWLPRARVILDRGAGHTFEAFDREAMLRREREPLADVLARFREVRARSLAELDGLGLRPDDLARTGTHPEFGTVTLGQLLATWVAHDLTHLGQIGEVLARRYRDDVGPWRAYLPALDRIAEAE
ncbi:DinB family protein [Nonomuraea sp. NPDC050310]|uniref:DinB family protein n=1 Tax=unclassified Nonomuraea TaxID=2593643 RepID=UPI0033E962CE